MLNRIDMAFFMPPPYGGVSVHVMRLSNYLRRQNYSLRTYRLNESMLTGCSDEHVLPPHIGKRFLPSGLSWLYKYGLKDRCDLVHCHFGVEWSYTTHKLRKKGIPCVQTIHNSTAPRDLLKSNLLNRRAFEHIAIDEGVQWIAVSDAVAAQLLALGVRSENIIVIPAFIPPDFSQAAPLPEQINTFINQHEPILSVCAFSYFPRDDNKEIYRLDDALSIIQMLKEKYHNIGLVACIPNWGDYQFAEEFKKKVVLMQMSDSVFIQGKAIDDAWRIWAASDVFLRPSSKDGDAVAIREALAAGTRVVASDSVVRPNRARIYPTGDLSAMASLVIEELNQPRHDTKSDENFAAQVIKIYQKVYNK